MTALTDQELSLLKALANEWEKSGPPGFVETAVIATELGVSIPNAKATIHSLFVKGFVGTDQVDIYAAYLTSEGYAIAKLATNSS